jgi:hypothetical protein
VKTGFHYIITPPGFDGTGKHYMGREISDVMGWQAHDWLDRPERESEERTDLLLQALELRPGMVIADIGAGTGYLSRRMSAAVGPDGRIHAVDVQPMMVRMLQRLTRIDGFANIEPSRCARNTTRSCPSVRSTWPSCWTSITSCPARTKCSPASCVPRDPVAASCSSNSRKRIRTFRSNPCTR